MMDWLTALGMASAVVSLVCAGAYVMLLVFYG